MPQRYNFWHHMNFRLLRAVFHAPCPPRCSCGQLERHRWTASPAPASPGCYEAQVLGGDDRQVVGTKQFCELDVFTGGVLMLAYVQILLTDGSAVESH